MKNLIFASILENALERTKARLSEKSPEYATSSDKLRHFRVAARLDNESMEKAWWGMFKKHLVSIMDMKNSPESITEYQIVEKIGDCMCYLHLFEAICRERLIARLKLEMKCEIESA